jgi:thiol-disulfide isomerase/thioredoxin
LLSGCEEAGKDWKRLDQPVPAQNFTLPQLDGPPVTLSELRGRVVVMEFWATWCGPCQFSSPSLDLIYRRYKDRGVTVLLVNQGESPEAIRAWVKERFIAPILLDARREVANRYRIGGLPSLFVIDQGGNILYANSGYRGRLEHNLKLILDELLSQPSTAHGG